MKFKYDEIFDIAYYKLANEKIYETRDYGENIAVDIDENGNMVGVEVQNYSKSLDELNQFFYKRIYDNSPIFEIKKIQFASTIAVNQSTKDKVIEAADYDYGLAA